VKLPTYADAARAVKGWLEAIDEQGAQEP
jgi:hypothetical protein